MQTFVVIPPLSIAPPKTVATNPGALPPPAVKTVQRPVFVAANSVAWIERTCAGSQCTSAVVFADTTLKETNRSAVPGTVTMAVADPAGNDVVVVADNRALTVKAGSPAVDSGGPFTGVTIDRRGHTIAWHGNQPGQASVFEDVQDRHTINGPTLSSLTYSPDGTQVGYISNGHLFVANADFTNPRDLTPTDVTPASVA